MAEAKLFSIGEVAKLFHVSVSSLRHYEAAGLLQPEYISPDSGYRHYSTRQFEVLNTLRYLRALGMPLHEIADFLQNRNLDSIEQKLCQQKAAVAEGVKEAKRAVKSKDAAQMASAAGRLEQLLQQAGVTIDPDAQYSGSYQNPNDQTPDDDVMDADFEEMD